MDNGFGENTNLGGGYGNGNNMNDHSYNNINLTKDGQQDTSNFGTNGYQNGGTSGLGAGSINDFQGNPNQNMNNGSLFNDYGSDNNNGFNGNGFNGGFGGGFGGGMGGPPPGPGGFNGGMGGPPPGYNNMNNGSVQDPLSRCTLWTVLGIIQIILICCGDIFTAACGVATMIFISKAKASVVYNDFRAFERNLKNAKTWNLVGWGVMIVYTIIGIIGGIFDIITKIFD